jgi:hypothetical protein
VQRAGQKLAAVGGGVRLLSSEGVLVWLVVGLCVCVFFLKFEWGCGLCVREGAAVGGGVRLLLLVVFFGVLYIYLFWVFGWGVFGVWCVSLTY